MFINEYGSREDPTIILLAPTMVSGADLDNPRIALCELDRVCRYAGYADAKVTNG